MHAHYKEAWYYDPVSTHPKKNEPKQQNLIIFVELGGGVGDVSSWCRGGTYIDFGFQ